MSYMLLILEEHGDRQKRGLEQGRVAYDRMLQFAEGLNTRGLLKTTAALKSDNEGVRLSVRNGKAMTLDGPFAESKEMIGGFFLLNCDTMEEALAIARQCPAAEWATVEVREIGTCYDGVV
ncbi:MAG TPA: YciI family protein [Micropepsaceae bacterium]|jgi:hypothetical protein|nr:YciI family protein [Micropepsaceae bacterium]